MDELLADLQAAILDGDGSEVAALVQDALNAGHNPAHLLNNTMIPAMDIVGEKYECGDFYLAEMLVSARAMQAGVLVLRPHLLDANVKAVGTVVMGTVKGDMHDIGKNLVVMMLEGAGFEVHDLGTDVHPQRFVEAVRERQPQVVALSALLTTTMANMKGTVDALVEAGLRQNVKVIVGGAPVTHAYAQAIGADGYTADASQAAALVHSLIQPN
ncbi:MAG: cobalamin B12-binding domain-containing protein [Caldilineaceae bacterium]